MIDRRAESKGTVRIVPLGGLGEIGLNLMVLEIFAPGADQPQAAVAIDCGVMFPTLETPGIDLMIPDLGYLQRLGDRLLAVILTHGHEDHMGALPFLLRERQTPIYGTEFTMGLVSAKLAEHGLLDGARLTTFQPRERIPIGPFEVEPFVMTHSIVDSVGLAIRTPVGTIVHTGDFKIDHTPVGGRTSDLARLAELGSEGVLLLFSDSTNVNRLGSTPSERAVAPALERIFRRTSGKILATTFASHIHRLQQLVDLAVMFDRRVALVGRSLAQNVEIARDLGKLEIPADTLLDVSEVPKLPPGRVAVLASGSQGEPRSALARVATDDHPHVKANPGDTAVISARIVPGNERQVATLVNHFFRRGAEVAWGASSEVHASGHASQEELKLVLRLARPRYFTPVHGEYRHLVRHVQLAVETGLSEENCFLLEDGQTLTIDGEAARRSELVEAGRVFVDGKGVGDVEDVVLRDRRHLAEDGFVLAILGVHSPSGEVVTGPELVTRGFLLEDASQPLLDEARAAILGALTEISPESRSDLAEVQESVRRTVKRFFKKRLNRRPMVLPFIMEM